MTALRDRLGHAPAHLPVAHDADRAGATLAKLDPMLTGGAFGTLLHGTAGSSPYLARLMARHAAWLTELPDRAPEETLAALIQDLDYAAMPDASFGDVASALRTLKSRAALLIALADLGGAWGLEDVVGALSDVANAAIGTASGWLLEQELAKNRLPGLAADARDHGAGYIVLAMGKLGAHELNYSSDIDLIALFDDDLFADADVQEARARYIHVTRQLVKLFSENTAEGYVFRTDLRLRPAPSTTPVCMSVTAAERYYETVGRTWERAAHIKARPLVDTAAGAAYLSRLSPFIWRRHLDFAAIEDVHALLRKIRAQKARFSPADLGGYDLKLGPGGIREIEFFAQTRQLILGGRDASIRTPGTLAALDALVDAGAIPGETRDTLRADYTYLRTLEHRLQMVEDAQTHAIPASPEGRTRVAHLAGHQDLASFEAELAEVLARVHDGCEAFFESRRVISPSSQDETELAGLGFERPDDAKRLIQRWHRGEIPATRSERAQSLLVGLEVEILTRLSGAADPDRALIQFDRFLSGLPAGVQVFSLFTANRQLLDLIVEVCSAAPRLARHLSRHAQTLDALLDRDFWQTLPDRTTLDVDLAARLDGPPDFERALDDSRRWARENWFRVGVHVLRHLADPVEAGAGFSRIADTYVDQLLPHVIDDVATRHGPPPGNGIVVLAMGKLGSGEMTAGSDLDLITIFDPGEAETSDGPKPLAPAIYYRRLTQALIAALTAPTAEGAVYEVDMRLRPSGNSGPVAVSLASFERYQTQDAWVWEHLALTRARVIAGPSDLAAKVADIARHALGARKGQDAVMAEAREMRARLLDAHAADRAISWSLKHTAGGLMEIEFLAQVGVLLNGLQGARPIGTLLAELADISWLSRDEAQVLSQTAHVLTSLQQVERVALDGPLDPNVIGPELRQVLARACGADNFVALEDLLKRNQADAATIVSRYLD